MEFMRSKVVTTNKPCKCFGCAREIPAKTRVRKTAWKDNGEFGSSNYCPVCQEYWSLYMDYDDEVGMGELRSEGGKDWEDLRISIEEL